MYELKNVGYWCFIGRLKKKEFKNFIGHCDMFDFFYEYDKFDFEKFDVSWLLSWGNIINLCVKVPQIYSPKCHKCIRENSTNLFADIDFFKKSDII